MGAPRHSLCFVSGLASGERATAILDEVIGAKKAVVVVDDGLLAAPSFPRAVLDRSDFEVIGVPAGEASKSFAQLEALLSAMARRGVMKDSVLVAVGGGMIGDLAGLAAALYMRGIEWILVPTTMLAQVDAAIGGKTAVNLAEGKNLAGLIYMPSCVLIDIGFLESLDDREVRAGLAEVLKCALLEGTGAVAAMQSARDAIMAREPAALAALVERTARFKLAIVQEDPMERGRRTLLNLGHTVAHALENLAGQDARSALRHGEAVAHGLRVEAEIARARGRLSTAFCERLASMLESFELLAPAPAFGWARYEARLGADKKRRAGALFSMVLLKEGAEAELVHDVGADELRAALACFGLLSR